MSTMASEYRYITIPDGEIGLSFTLEGSASVVRNQQCQRIPTAAAYGLIKASQVIQLSTGLKAITVTFQPYVLRLFHSQSMHYLADGEPVNLIDLFGKSSIEELHERLYTASNDLAMLELFEAFLATRNIKERSNEILLEAYRLITQNKIRSVERISQQLDISGTRLRTLFRENIGLSPKDLIKIYRIKEAVLSNRNSKESLTEMSYRLGYTDQAHFIHEFKSILGTTPRKYFKENLHSVDFYNFEK